MNVTNHCALLLLSFVWLYAADALYFNVVKENARCFVVDVPAETPIRAEYESPDTTEVMKTVVAFYALGLDETMDNKSLVKKEPTSQKGSISFMAPQNGLYSICVSLDSSNYALPDGASMRFALRLVLGTSQEEYQNLAKKNQMDDLHLAIMKLRDRVAAIQSNQDYAKEKILRLQSSIERNNQRAAWVSVLQVEQIAILLATSIYQAKYLQAYFQKKKLV